MERDGDTTFGIGAIFILVGYFALIAYIARSKNRRVCVWLLFAVVFPILALIVLIFAYPLAKDGEHDDGIA